MPDQESSQVRSARSARSYEGTRLVEAPARWAHGSFAAEDGQQRHVDSMFVADELGSPRRSYISSTHRVDVPTESSSAGGRGRSPEGDAGSTYWFVEESAWSREPTL